LTDFLLDRLSAAESESLASHIEQCQPCAARLLELAAQGAQPSDPFAQDTFLALAENPSICSLVERLRARNADSLTLVQTTTASHSASLLAAGTPLGLLAPPEAPDELGRLAHYRIVRVLGQGGMGVVFQAEDTQLCRPVALKVMQPSAAADPISRDRFLREARATAALEHDHIIAIYQVGQDRGAPYLAMQLLQGMPLDQWLHQWEEASTPQSVPLPEVLRIGREIAAGLAAAHARGLVHRDIKPANIWLESGRGNRVKILDFGLARGLSDNVNLTQSGVIVGTPAYMAPEQARGEAVDYRADLFSLGCILYQLCTGQRPFQAPTTIALLLAVVEATPKPVLSFNPRVPPALVDLIVRLLAKQPADRPDSAQAVVETLQAVEQSLNAPTLAEQTPVGSSVAALSAPAPAPRKSGHGALLVAGLALLAVLGVSGIWWGPALFRSASDSGKDSARGGATQVEAQKPEPNATTKAAPDGCREFVTPDGTTAVMYDATEADLQSWFQHLKGRGYRPTLINNTLRGTEPRFAALAVKSATGGGWEAYFDQRPEEFWSRFESLLPKHQWPVSVCVVASGTVRRVVSVWASQDKAVEGRFCWTALTPAGLAEKCQKVKGYCRLEQVSGYVVEDAYHLAALFGPEDGTRWHYLLEQTAENLRNAFDRLRPTGFRPVSLFICPKGGEPRFGVVMRDDPSLDWEARQGLTAEECDAESQRQAAHGYRPSLLAGYPEGSTTRYVAVWIKERPNAPPVVQLPPVEPNYRWHALVHAHPRAYHAWLDQMRSLGCRPVFVNGHGVAGQPYLSAVAVRDNTPRDWQSFDDPQSTFQQRFDTQVNQGYWTTSQTRYRDRGSLTQTSVWERPIPKQGHFNRGGLTLNAYESHVANNTLKHLYPREVIAYPNGDSYLLGALSAPDGGHRWLNKQNLTVEQYQAFLTEGRNQGFRPVSVFVAPEAGTLRFGAVLLQDNPKLVWEERHGLTIAEYNRELRHWAVRGYRPQLVVGYEQDRDSRYVGVWVKDGTAAFSPISGTAVPELAAVDEAVQQFMRERAIPAGSLAVTKGGKLLLNRGYGFADRAGKRPVTPTTPFRLGNVTKPITAAAIRKLAQSKKLRLDDRVTSVLKIEPPAGQKMDPRWHEITIQHLLAHEGGWDHRTTFDVLFRPLEVAAALGKQGVPSAQDIITYMAGQPLQFKPGSKSVYSNFGYCLLGRVIEKVSGQSYLDYVRSEILAPLGIKQVAVARTLPSDRQPGEPYYVADHLSRNIVQLSSNDPVPYTEGGFSVEAMDSLGGLVMTAADVARFFEAYEGDGRPAGRQRPRSAWFGSMPGTFTMVLNRVDGIHIVALFNQWNQAQAAEYLRLRASINEALKQVKQWPMQEVVR
jgi:serine/threonine protein kinase/CubicO group peptidase (beta-lactamase class C family)